MAVFNGQEYLPAAVESILGQSCPDFEFIIIDDGSSSPVPEMLGEYARRDGRIVIFTQPNRGLAAALNAGAAQARGKYLARMDADDIARPERFAVQTAYLDAHPEVAVLGGAIQIIDARGAPLYISRYPLSPAEIRAALPYRNVINHPSAMIRTSIFRESGGYRPIFRVSQDYDLWLRMSETVDLANLPNVLTDYRVHLNKLSAASVDRQAVSALAAKASAARRRTGQPDPAEAWYDEVTLETILELGMDSHIIRTGLVLAYLYWANLMALSGRGQELRRFLGGAWQAWRLPRGGKNTEMNLDLYCSYFPPGILRQSLINLARVLVRRPWLLLK